MLSRKYQLFFFVLVLSLFLSSIVISSDSVNLSILKTDTSHPSSVVWSDDFENATKTLSEWTIDGFHNDGPEPYTANITVSDGLLYSNLFSNGTGFNILTHNSTTATGTWSVDVFPGEDFVHVMIFFMSPYWSSSSDYMGTPLGYSVSIEPDQTRLGYWEPELSGHLLMTLDSASISMTPGWRHIDITRQSDDMMYVYIDGVLWLQGEDSRHHSSEHFRLWIYGPAIFDNITVSDTVDIDGVAPHWVEPLDNQSIDEGDDFMYFLHADDYSGLDTWWIDDTANFAIDQEGNLTSVNPLPVGIYGIEVCVNDTFGNVLNGTFGLRVIEGPPTGTPPQLESILILAISIGSLGVIVVMTVLIVRIKRNQI